jgi:hypothetical protein
MPHLLLTSTLLFALLAILATIVGSCLGIAREVMLNGHGGAPDTDILAEPSPIHGSTHGTQVGLAEEFGLGLRHAGNFARDSDEPFRGNGSLNA